jgi:phage nucleotide-binding protein
MTVQIQSKKSKPYIKAVIYADQGIGKTTLSVSGKGHPDLDEILLVNIDKGELSIDGMDIATATIGTDEKGVSTKSIVKDLEDVIYAILNKKPGFEKFKTVVVDTISELQSKDLEDVSGGREIFTQQDYGKSTKKLKKLCALIRDVPLNIILTAQVKRIYDGAEKENRKLVEIRPDITESAGNAIMAAVNFVWYLYVPEATKERTLITKNMGIVRGKTRNPKFQEMLGDKVEKPNLASMYEKLLKATE